MTGRGLGLCGGNVPPQAGGWGGRGLRMGRNWGGGRGQGFGRCGGYGFGFGRGWGRGAPNVSFGPPVEAEMDSLKAELASAKEYVAAMEARLSELEKEEPRQE